MSASPDLDVRGAIAAVLSLPRSAVSPEAQLSDLVPSSFTLIELVLERTGGNQVKAAQMLGINRNTLRKKISELGVTLRRPGASPSS